MKKLTLEELSVKSFITNEKSQEVRGGFAVEGTHEPCASWLEVCPSDRDPICPGGTGIVC